MLFLARRRRKGSEDTEHAGFGMLVEECAAVGHGNPRAPDLVSGHASKGYFGDGSRMRREDQFSISSLSLADLGGETIAGSHAVSGNHKHCA